MTTGPRWVRCRGGETHQFERKGRYPGRVEQKRGDSSIFTPGSGTVSAWENIIPVHSPVSHTVG